MNRRFELAVASLVTGAALLVLFLDTTRLTPELPLFRQPLDHQKYIAMASGDSFSMRIAPFCWRVLNPLLVKLLPFGVQAGFTVTNIAGLWVAGVLMFLVLRSLAFSFRLSLLGPLLFASMPFAMKFNLFNFWLTDALAFAFIAGAFLALVSGHDLVFMAVMAVGALAKESVLFVAPLYYTFRATRVIDPAAMRRALLLATPALLGIAAIRTAIPAGNTDLAYMARVGSIAGVSDHRPYTIVYQFNEHSRSLLGGMTFLSAATLVVATFGWPVLALPLLAPRANLRWAWKFAPLIALAAVTSTFGNVERLLVVAFPALIVMAAEGARSIEKTSSR